MVVQIVDYSQCRQIGSDEISEQAWREAERATSLDRNHLVDGCIFCENQSHNNWESRGTHCEMDSKVHSEE